jgi:hypothetical protein
MNDLTKSVWAAAMWNGDFMCVETRSGYRGSTGADPKGAQHLLPPDATDDALGVALLDALAHSRFVLAAPRTDVWIHPEVEFDRDLYDYEKCADRHVAWTRALMARYHYKTKRALFKNMELCNVTVTEGLMKIVPMRHVKLEAWQGISPGDPDAVGLPVDSAPAEIGAALRLAFSRCTG